MLRSVISLVALIAVVFAACGPGTVDADKGQTSPAVAPTVTTRPQPTSTTVTPMVTTTRPTPVTTTSTTPRVWTGEDLEAAAVDAIAGAGTMVIHEGSVSRYRDAFRGFPPSTSPQYAEVLRSRVAQTYLALAPLPETRLQEGAVWLASFASPAGAERFISEVTTAFREAADPVRLPTSEFDVRGIDGARGFLVRWDPLSSCSDWAMSDIIAPPHEFSSRSSPWNK